MIYPSQHWSSPAQWSTPSRDLPLPYPSDLQAVITHSPSDLLPTVINPHPGDYNDLLPTVISHNPVIYTPTTPRQSTQCTDHPQPTPVI